MPSRQPVRGGGGGMERYERVKVLGKGTFGRAWLVKDRKSKSLWVAKEIKCESKQDLEEALAEAEVLSKVEHFNIISYKDVLRTSSKLVTIVMEFADDGDIAEKIARRKFRNQFFEEDLICRWFIQLCQAIDYLHQRGILHRDIKTANLFLMKSGALKLGDFGIARILDSNADRMSARTCRTAVGTPMYMCPELCQGTAYGQKADMWSLGCVLYEMCALRPAFMAHSMEGLVAKIKRGNHDKHMPKMYSPELRQLVTNCLQVNPELRPHCTDVLALPFLQTYVASAPATLIANGSATAEQLRAVGSLPTAPVDQSQSVPEIMVLDDSGTKAGPSAFRRDKEADRRRSMQPEHERALRSQDALGARGDQRGRGNGRDRSPAARDRSSGRGDVRRDRSPAGRDRGGKAPARGGLASPGRSRTNLNPVDRIRGGYGSSRDSSPASRDPSRERDASRSRERLGPHDNSRDPSRSRNNSRSRDRSRDRSSNASSSPPTRRPNLHVQGNEARGRSRNPDDRGSQHGLHASPARGRSNSPAARYGSNPNQPSIAQSDMKDLASWYKDHGVHGANASGIPHQKSRASPLVPRATSMHQKLPKLN